MKHRHRHMQKPKNPSAKLVRMFQELVDELRDLFVSDPERFIIYINSIWGEFPDHKIKTSKDDGIGERDAGIYINYGNLELGRIDLDNSSNQLILEHIFESHIYIKNMESVQIHQQTTTQFNEVLSSILLPLNPHDIEEINRLNEIMEKIFMEIL